MYDLYLVLLHCRLQTSFWFWSSNSHLSLSRSKYSSQLSDLSLRMSPIYSVWSQGKHEIGIPRQLLLFHIQRPINAQGVVKWDHPRAHNSITSWRALSRSQYGIVWSVAKFIISTIFRFSKGHSFPTMSIFPKTGFRIYSFVFNSDKVGDNSSSVHIPPTLQGNWMVQPSLAHYAKKKKNLILTVQTYWKL